MATTDVEKFRQRQEQNSQWSDCDPMTLVSAARSKLYEIPEGQRQEVEGPLSELISRFDQQSRAALGANAAALGSFIES